MDEHYLTKNTTCLKFSTDHDVNNDSIISRKQQSKSCPLSLFLELSGILFSKSSNLKSIFYTKDRLLTLAFLFVSFLGFSQTILNSETFESNFGIWTSGGSNVIRSTGAPYLGTSSIRFRGTSNMTLTSPTTGINTLPYNKIDIKFFAQANVNSDENITLQYRSNISIGWQDVKVIIKGSGAPGSTTGKDINSNGVYHAFYATLFSTDYTFSASSQFRFEAVIGNNLRYFYLDNISIIGTTYNNITKGPGGVTANLETWLRADKVNGTGTIANNSIVNTWQDVGKGNDANVIDETNTLLTNKPVYKDNTASNLNFNPVVFFDNNTATTVSDLSGLTNRAEMNGTGGFFTNEQFIVIINDTPSTTANLSLPSDIYCSQTETGTPYSTDVTGFGLGSYTGRFIDEVISYCIGSSPATNSVDVNLRGYGIAQTSTTTSYENLTTILNARNLITVPTTNGMELYKDGLKIDNIEVGVPKFENSINNRYWLGRSQAFNGSFGGRIAEVISYSARKNNTTERRKIESYLAIKYGITLGVNGTSLDYQDNNGIVIWSVAGNLGFNFDIAGIGRDDASELNQKQSKSINASEVMTIGLSDIAATNSANTATYAGNSHYLIWGSNGATMSNSGVNLEIDLGPTTISTITEVVNRKWKVIQVNGDVPEARVAIPTAAFLSGLPALGPTDAYVMVVATNAAFTTGLETVFMSTSGTNETCLYDFDDTKYITFGIAHRATNPLHITLDGLDDYVRIGNSNNLPATFSVMTWIRPNGANTLGNERTILSKKSAAGNGYQIVLQNDDRVRFEWYNGSAVLRTAITNTILPNAKWHNIAYTYTTNRLSIYIDGVLEKTVIMTGNPSISTGLFSIGGQYISKTVINNLFKGDLDELRMWDRVLTATEIQFIMNQEILQNSSGTKGTIIPTIPSQITKNDINLLNWNNLFAYYSMNSYIGTHLDDDSINVNRGSLVIPDKISINIQTAPMPYTSDTSGLWQTLTTWKNGTNQDTPYSLSIIDNTTPIAWNIVKTNNNITSQGNQTVLGLFVNSNTLTATTTGGLPIHGTKIEVSHYLKLDGKIDLAGRSQLVQTEGSDLDPTSTGSLERDQQGQANKFNYNYWSSPVGTINATTNNNNFTVAGVLRDGTDPSVPKAINWVPGYNGSPGPPINLAGYWIYKFDSNLNAIDYANWTQIGENGMIQAGKGFTLKGSGTSGIQNLTFVGKPNNGTITNNVSANQLLLVGNPYPSALDAITFITDNSGSIDTTTPTATEGALYFWEHYPGNNTHNVGGYQGGYGVRNAAAGVAPSSVGVDFINSSGVSNRALPNRYIPVGQGFFVIGNATGGTVTFKNSQRAFIKEDNAASQIMYRIPTNPKELDHWTDNSDDPIKKDTYKRVRLGFNNYNEIFHRQVVIAFMDEKANGEINEGYDAENIDDVDNDMYLVNSEKELIIEGEGYFDETSSYPVGVRSDSIGKISFVLDGLENFDDNQKVFIYDKSDDTYHNIKDTLYEVELPKGTFNDRFYLRFIDKTLGTDTFNLSKSDGVIVVVNQNVTVQSSNQLIKNIAIYDLLGRKIDSYKKVNALKYTLSHLNKMTRGLIVKITLDNDTVVSKKIIY